MPLKGRKLTLRISSLGARNGATVHSTAFTFAGVQAVRSPNRTAILRAPPLSKSSEDEFDGAQFRFQEAHGARLFRQGKPRVLLEVKSPNIPTAIYEARLRGYDRAKTLKERPSQVRKK